MDLPVYVKNVFGDFIGRCSIREVAKEDMRVVFRNMPGIWLV